MNLRSPGGSVYDQTDAGNGSFQDYRQRDRTLCALEGRNSAGDPDCSQATSPHLTSSLRRGDTDTTGDIFMRIAGEDTQVQHSYEGDRQSDNPGSDSRIGRTASQRRPFSAAVPSRQKTPPPPIARRLSDQRETSRPRRMVDEQAALRQQQPQTLQQQQTLHITRDTPPRTLISERNTPLRSATIPHRPESSRTRTVVSSTRPSPSTPRTAVIYDTTSEVGTNYSRRRPSVTESISSNAPLPLRASSIKASHSHARIYNSSPLVPRNADLQRQEHNDGGHPSLGVTGMDSTESTASTAAPSTVWDELDDLKSRMRRLELTGKLPSTAGAAMSRASDERPRTATTSATTMSGSPKRVATNAQAAEVRSTTSSQQHQAMQSPLQRDGQQGNQSVLQSALRGVKKHISADVYSAIETAATEAMALTQMVGAVGQPGPISSGASAIGTGMPTTVTDRQLRRKAENICRNLTELCLALNDEATHRKAAAAAAAAAQLQAIAAPPQPTHLEQQQQEIRQQQEQQSRQDQQHLQHQHQQQPQRQQQPQLLQQQPQHTPRSSRDDPIILSSPKSATENAFASLAESRRAVIMEPVITSRFQTSPRTATRYEDRRTSFLNKATVPPPRYPLPPPVSSENVGRRSSLMITRTRRAASEDADEIPQASSRRSSLLRSQRAGTGEPEDGRKPLLLFRTRRTAAPGEIGEDEPEGYLVRSPSRSVTEVAGLRTTPGVYQPRQHLISREYIGRGEREQPAREREYASQLQYTSSSNAVQQYPIGTATTTASNTAAVAANAMRSVGDTSGDAGHHQPLASSALPRHRLIPSSLNARLVTPQTTTTAVTVPSTQLSGRRYFERGASQDRDGGASIIGAGSISTADKFGDERLERMQRQLSMGQPALLSRSGAANRRISTLDSSLPSMPSAASQAGGYR